MTYSKNLFFIFLLFLSLYLLSSYRSVALASPCGNGYPGGSCPGSQTCACVDHNPCPGDCPSYDQNFTCSCEGGGGGGSCGTIGCPPGWVRTNIPVGGMCAAETCAEGDAQLIDWSSPCMCENRCSEHEHPNGRVEEHCEYSCQGFNRTTFSCKLPCEGGSAPTLITPPNAQIFSGPSGAANVDFAWNATTNWGSGENVPVQSRSYNLCVGTNISNPCAGGQIHSSSTTTKTASVPFGNQYWGVTSVNMCGSSSAISAVRSVCVEGYTLPGDNGVGNAYFSQWSSCNASHKRTRTCREDCGTDNCSAAASAGLLTEDCQGSIRGTIFDATDVTSCPSFNPTTGYLVGVDTNLTANNRTFGMADQSNTSPHPWSTISAPQTDSAGNYAVTVYAPATYTYDFSSLRDMYVVSEGPKLACTSIAATVPGNNPSCGTQPCRLVNNMSFGFNRYWGGWWQAVGASVHAEDGLRSNIPTPLAAEQSLITEDTNGRSGVVSYGTTLGNMLGVNLGAQMSAKLWEVQSNYESIIYDYGYFAQRAKRFTTTDWNGTSPIVYDDNGKGYQIIKVTGDLTNFNYNPTGTEKLIFLVNGNVTVTSNLLIPNGAFMAVIANGDLTFNTNVTRADGWFLAKNINLPCVDSNSDLICDRTDTQFLGNGSFVAWRDINLRRDRDGAANITGPSSKFTYRLDLFTNAPDPLKNTTKFYKPFIP